MAAGGGEKNEKGASFASTRIQKAFSLNFRENKKLKARFDKITNS